MIIPNEEIIAGSPDESDGSDDTELNGGSRFCSDLVWKARRRGSGQSEQRRYIREEPKADTYQVARMPPPRINTLGSGCTDPFKTLPNLAGGDTELLTHHCKYHSKILSFGPRVYSL
jgi:hypothetical protein